MKDDDIKDILKHWGMADAAVTHLVPMHMSEGSVQFGIWMDDMF